MLRRKIFIHGSDSDNRSRLAITGVIKFVLARRWTQSSIGERIKMLAAKLLLFIAAIIATSAVSGEPNSDNYIIGGQNAPAN